MWENELLKAHLALMQWKTIVLSVYLLFVLLNFNNYKQNYYKSILVGRVAKFDVVLLLC